MARWLENCPPLPPMRQLARPKPDHGAKRDMKLAIATAGWRELCAQGLILAISTTIVVIWVWTKPIVFTYDSFTYINQAYELQAGRQLGVLAFSRLPLYPAILWALHVTDLQHSVSSLIIFQS